MSTDGVVLRVTSNNNSCGPLSARIDSPERYGMNARCDDKNGRDWAAEKRLGISLGRAGGVSGRLLMAPFREGSIIEFPRSLCGKCNHLAGEWTPIAGGWEEMSHGEFIHHGVFVIGSPHGRWRFGQQQPPF
jgi:hypothetical protein